MRFKVTGTITYFVESESAENAADLANEEISKFPAGFDLRLLRLDKLKEKIEKIKIGEFSLDEVLPYITEKKIKKEYEYDGVKYSVNMNSPRYFLFRDNLSCAVCGLIGTRMFLEYHPKDRSPHFNLYGEENGQLILMTKDHIHAKSFGGRDLYSNYALMCMRCNSLKGNFNLTLNNVRELNNIYKDNYKKVPSKKLHLLLDEKRKELAKPWLNYKELIITQLEKSGTDCVITNCDLNVIKTVNEQELTTNYIYDSIENRIGCIKKWTYFEPILSIGDIIVCELSKDVYLKINTRFLYNKKQFLKEFIEKET